jgi:hypothetical protein
MSLFDKKVKIDFATIDDDEVTGWAKSLGLEFVDEIPDLEITIKVDFHASELSDDDIKREFSIRFRDDEDTIARAYGLLAAGAIDDAMDLMAREFRLAPPSHEKKIADLLARGRGSHVQD